jgi:hypothetical protein
MAKRRGGGLFTYVADPLTGATKLTTLSVVLILLLGVGIVLAIVLPLTLLKPKDDSNQEQPTKGGGSVSPGMNKLPGQITIAEVTQAPSAGQGIIYFSQAQASGTVCDTCTATFDINLTYSGGIPSPAPVYKQLTAPSTSGVVTFDYSVPTQTGGSTSPQPTPPAQVSVEVKARSVSSQDPSKTSAPTTFTKTIPYVA